jgi:tetratricopeptide (TPR) repeat protein
VVAIRVVGLLACSFWVSTLCGCPSKREDAREIAGPSAPQLGFADAEQEVERAPITLTASDGSGLSLVAVEVRTVIEDPLAFTELHLTFHNPEPRRREGRFQIVLPEAAAISRFAMRVGAEFQEGEVVERQRAQQVYEDFLHRKQDPALLEKSAGNEFSARVFPIEPSADKEIIVSYSEELPERGRPYRLLVAGLPRLARFAADVRLGSHSASGLESTSRERGESQHLRIEKLDYAPRSDLLLRLPAQKPFALRSGDLVVARVRPLPAAERGTLDKLTVLFDTSASRALGFGAQIERFAALLRELVRQNKRDFALRVVAFDQDSEEIYRGSASGFSLRDQGRLLARDAFGATDLAQALSGLSEQPDGHARLLILSDGMLTAGELDGTRLREAVTRLSAHGLRRLDVVAEGSVRERGVLADLTHAGLKEAGALLDASSEPDALAGRLLLSVRESVRVEVSGARWVHPRALLSVQPGDERLVFAQVPADQPLQIELEGAGVQALETLEAPRPLLERAWARAKIEALTQELNSAGRRTEDTRVNFAREIIALSTQHRVLSDLTALLVLESEWDYRRFGISQEALTSILRVGQEGIELWDRGARGHRTWDDEPPREIAKDEALSEGEAQPSAAAPASELSLPSVRGAVGAPQPERRGGGDEKARARDQRTEPELKRAPGSPVEGLAERASSAGRASEPPVQAAPAAAPKAASVSSVEASDARGPAKSDALQGVLGGAGSGAPHDGLGSAGSVARQAGSALGSAGPGARQETAARGTGDLQVAAPVVLEARAVVTLHEASGVPQSLAARALRGTFAARARACYQRAGARDGSERLFLDFSISARGTVDDVYVSSGSLADSGVKSCLLGAARALQFPKPDAASGNVRAGVELSFVEAALRSAPSVARPARPRPSVKIVTPAVEDAYDGTLAAVLNALRAGDAGGARSKAEAAHREDPGDVMALVALGEALEAQHELARAARVYGSLIDLFPARTDLRRMAGARLERLSDAGLALAVDSYEKARQQRPDHPSVHRLLAFAQLKRGQAEAAFQTLEAALERAYREDRFPGAARILGEDLALVAAAFLRAAPQHETRIRAVLAARQLSLDTKPSLRFVLNWETDANDVDFHIYDGRGGHAFYMQPRLGSGGALYADVTSGYGPECFAIAGAARAYPYVLQAHYFARGPMGYGMGKLQIIEHDGRGALKFAEHPFVIMKDKAFVELARVPAPLAG